MKRMISILAADDDPLQKLIWNKVLANSRLKITFATNGKEVIEADLSQIDIIFTDINMPQLDGIKATKYLREHHVRIPIIGVTANTDSKTKAACKKACMNEVLHKPILPDTLKTAIARWLPWAC